MSFGDSLEIANKPYMPERRLSILLDEVEDQWQKQYESDINEFKWLINNFLTIPLAF